MDTAASVATYGASPPQDQLIRRYMSALRAWGHVNRSISVQFMTRREYCDRYVSGMGPICWTTSMTNTGVGMGRRPIDPDTAYQAALEIEGVA